MIHLTFAILILIKTCLPSYVHHAIHHAMNAVYTIVLNVMIA